MIIPSAHTDEVSSGERISYWLDTATMPEYTPLAQDITTDVLVIGGGISGLTAAYCLLKEGKQVTLVEDGLLGSGESGRTTAHLTCALDDRYYTLQEVFGEEGIRLIAQSHMKAIDFIEATVNELGIDCHFRRLDGYLFLHASDKNENLEKELEACKLAGIPVKRLSHIPGISQNSYPCIAFPNQAQFHIMKYLAGLAQAVTRLGGKIYTRSRAKQIHEKGALCNGHTIWARDIVVATNTPVNDFVTMHTKQFPFRSYVIAALIPKASLQPALWWDTGNQDSKWYSVPYHYVRVEEVNEVYDLLIAGGEDHRTGQADEDHIPEEERYKSLIAWTRQRFPMMRDVVYKWSGQVMEPLDHLAFIGKNPGNDHIYIITGDSGNGMTHGTLGGLIITDQVTGRRNAWEKIYSPKRLPVKVAGKYLKALGDMVLQYGDWFYGESIKEIKALKGGEGAVLTDGLKKYAVYKDEHGEVKAYSAVCPHMGCVLKWNAGEKSFDCPCHGSRFSKTGEVMNGPATTNLKPVNMKFNSHENNA